MSHPKLFAEVSDLLDKTRLDAETWSARAVEAEAKLAAPIDMIIFCHRCGVQHIDEVTPTWANPPHKSHLCHSCGLIFRVADVATNGVKEIQTIGEHDNIRLRQRIMGPCVYDYDPIGRK